MIKFKKIIRGVLRRYFGTQIIKVHFLGQNITPQKTDVDELVKQLEFDDFLIGDKEEFTSEKLDVIKRRLNDNTYKAYGIVENGKLVYSCWISLEKLGLPVVLKDQILLEETQGYLEDAYCSVQARGRGYHTKMITYRLSRLHDYGKQKGVITVIDGNIPALKANVKSGMKDVGVFYCGKLLGKSFCTLTKEKRAQFDSKI